MSGPNHLWSGDWERESARAGEQRAEIPRPAETEPEPEREGTESASVWRRRTLFYTASASLLAVIVGVALAVTLGGGSPKPSGKKHQATVQTAPAPTTGPSGGAALQARPPTTGPTANWLGMQIVTSPTGAVVATVALGSPGDVAGFEPGDVLDSINGKQINSARQIRSSTANVPLGSRVEVEINRGSTVITVLFPMKGRPTIQP